VAWNQAATPPTGAGAWTAAGEYDPPPVSDGTWYLWVRVQDSLGRWGSWGNPYLLRYDHTPPCVTLDGAGLAAPARSRQLGRPGRSARCARS
jgi:hypothetical protein